MESAAPFTRDFHPLDNARAEHTKAKAARHHCQTAQFKLSLSNNYKLLFLNLSIFKKPFYYYRIVEPNLQFYFF